jgi:hypothetical protein
MMVSSVKIFDANCWKTLENKRKRRKKVLVFQIDLCYNHTMTVSMGIPILHRPAAAHGLPDQKADEK